MEVSIQEHWQSRDGLTHGSRTMRGYASFTRGISMNSSWIRSDRTRPSLRARVQGAVASTAVSLSGAPVIRVLQGCDARVMFKLGDRNVFLHLRRGGSSPAKCMSLVQG